MDGREMKTDCSVSQQIDRCTMPLWPLRSQNLVVLRQRCFGEWPKPTKIKVFHLLIAARPFYDQPKVLEGLCGFEIIATPAVSI